MPQMDKELFIEYIFWIFIVLLHFYSSFFINKNLLRINGRHYIIQNFFDQRKYFKEQENIIKNTFENFSKKI